MHEQIYSLIYTSGSESDDTKSGSDDEDNVIESSTNHENNIDRTACQADICNCENNKFYKLKSQFEYLNTKTLTSDNVIELLKEVSHDKVREKMLASCSQPISKLTKELLLNYRMTLNILLLILCTLFINSLYPFSHLDSKGFTGK